MPYGRQYSLEMHEEKDSQGRGITKVRAETNRKAAGRITIKGGSSGDESVCKYPSSDSIPLN